MLRPRIIPCLLVHKGGLVKTVEFGQPKYVGDPINAIKVFNEKRVDEIMVVDIDATVNKQEPDYNLISSLAEEARMPVCYAGGVSSVDQIRTIVSLGVEKVGLSSAAIENPQIIADGAAQVGSQSLAVILDVKRERKENQYRVYTHNGRVPCEGSPVDIAQNLCRHGAGELIVYSIDRDGTGLGYDFDVIQMMRSSVTVPITAIGGAGGSDDLAKLIDRFSIIGAGAGDMFVFKGKFKAVLITYPSNREKFRIYGIHDGTLERGGLQ